MATNLDLEEQEQLDQLKAFWARYGNLVLWVLVLGLGIFAGWNYYNHWTKQGNLKAGVLFDELGRSVQAGDVEKTARVFSDMKQHHAGAAYTEQAALVAAKLQADKGQADAAQATLTWAAEHAADAEYKTLARLRLAGLLLDQKKYDEALKQLDAAGAKEFAGLVADRRGDVLMAQGRADDAKLAYQAAWKAIDPAAEYRQLTEAKLIALGAAPEAEAAKATP